MRQTAGGPADLLFSAAEDFLDAAAIELREAFPDAEINRLGPDLGRFSLDGVAIAGLAEACRNQPSFFVRHLARQVGAVPATPGLQLQTVVEQALEIWQNLPLTASASLQVWSSGALNLAFQPNELRFALTDALAAQGMTVTRGGHDQVLSAVLTEDQIILGLNSVTNALSDWPGGRVQLAKPKGQISRSEFKLEELFRTTTILIPTTGVAIDLGASPGGWTRILRQRGLIVWAIDPAELDPRLRADPDIHHVRTTAGPFLAATDLEADLVVNDMRMTADLSAQVMLGAAKALKPGGWMIQTLKITPHNPVRVVQDAISRLETAYEIVFAHQLHHNRHEVTVVGKRKP